MSVAKKNKWRRALSHLRFSYEEVDIIREIARDTAQDFQAHYENFCRTRGINIAELNDRHRERVKDLYNIEKTIPDSEHTDKTEIHAPDDTTIALHNKNSDEQDGEREMTADETAVHEAFSKLFKKIALKPNQSQKVSFTISADDLAFYTRDMSFKAEAGDFRLFIGSSSEDLQVIGFKLTAN